MEQFKIGDRVKIIDVGETYDTYWDTYEKPDYAKNWTRMGHPEKGIYLFVKGMFPHERMGVQLLAVGNDEEDYLIGVAGVEKANLRFKVGDKVVVKELEVGKYYDGLFYNPLMESFAGEELEITEVKKFANGYKLNGALYTYNDAMLGPADSPLPFNRVIVTQDCEQGSVVTEVVKEGKRASNSISLGKDFEDELAKAVEDFEKPVIEVGGEVLRLLDEDETAFWCKDKITSNNFLYFLGKHGYSWNSGHPLANGHLDFGFSFYGRETCYSAGIQYADKDYYESIGYRIVDVSEIEMD